MIYKHGDDVGLSGRVEGAVFINMRKIVWLPV